MIPSSAAGKKYIKEITRLLKLRVHDSSLKTIALKTIHVMAALLLLKPSKSSNSKDHLVSLFKVCLTILDHYEIKGKIMGRR